MDIITGSQLLSGMSLGDAVQYAETIEEGIERFNKSYLTKTEKVILVLKQALDGGGKII